MYLIFLTIRHIRIFILADFWQVINISKKNTATQQFLPGKSRYRNGQLRGTRYSCIVPPPTTAEFWRVAFPMMAPLPAVEYPQSGVQNDPSPPIAFHSCCAGKTRVFP